MLLRQHDLPQASSVGLFHLPNTVRIRYLALLDDWFIADQSDKLRLLMEDMEL